MHHSRQGPLARAPYATGDDDHRVVQGDLCVHFAGSDIDSEGSAVQAGRDGVVGLRGDGKHSPERMSCRLGAGLAEVSIVEYVGLAGINIYILVLQNQ